MRGSPYVTPQEMECRKCTGLEREPFPTMRNVISPMKTRCQKIMFWEIFAGRRSRSTLALLCEVQERFSNEPSTASGRLVGHQRDTRGPKGNQKRHKRRARWPKRDQRRATSAPETPKEGKKRRKRSARGPKRECLGKTLLGERLWERTESAKAFLSTFAVWGTGH